MRVTQSDMRLHRSSLVLLIALVSGCNSKPDATPTPSNSAEVKPSAQATSSNVAPAASSAAIALPPGPSAKGFYGETLRTLSEKGGDFISDNLISNETSYLQQTKTLVARPAGGVYIGVGPEQNFTYMAMTKPNLAIIVDIRRDNLLQHLYYRYLFEEAKDRAHFVALLVGRPYDEASAPAEKADFEAVAKAAEKMAPDPKLQKSNVEAAILRITNEWGVVLDDKDKKSIRDMAQVFFDKQLDLRFELKESSGRKYPTLRELMAMKDPAGTERSFLATNESFQFVQAMERDGRVLPVVGDFGGETAFSAIARYLKGNDMRVNTFYVSNVEQYLLEPKTWNQWLHNIDGLPRSDDAIFIRCYLDQGKKHPQEMEGHRTATVLSKINTFLDREKVHPSRSFFTVATEGNLP